MTQPMGAEKIRFDQAVVFTVVVPVVYAALRLMIFARGDTNRLRALVANLDVKAVILGTVLPLGATFLFWAMWVFVFDVVSKSKAAESGGVAEAVAKKHSQSTLLAVSMIGIIAVWWAMPMRHMAINGAILAGFMLALLGRKRRQQGPIAFLSSVVGLILLLAFGSAARIGDI